MEVTPQMIDAYFTPLDYFFYLSTIVVAWAIWLQWKWTNVCKNNILVLIQRIKGNGDWMLSPISGNTIQLPKNPSNPDATGIWPIKDINTIDVPYPGVGFIPKFLQKQIRMVVISEADCEPITNRSDNEVALSPYFIGNLVNEKITEAMLMVNKDLVDAIKNISKMLNPTHFYIGMGGIAVLLGYIIVKLNPLFSIDFVGIQTTLDAIVKGLGL